MGRFITTEYSNILEFECSSMVGDVETASRIDITQTSSMAIIKAID